MCDFSSYSDRSDEWLAIEASLPPPPPATRSLADEKRITNEGREATAAAEMKALAPAVVVRDYPIPTRDGCTIEARSYRPSALDPAVRAPVYLHLHGGGFFYGSLASEDATCARIAIGANAVILNVNYRHTPEHTYPTAWDDAQDAFAWLHAHMDEVGGDAQQVVVGGISAGAQLAASLVLEKHLGRALQSLPAIAGQVLMVPWLVHMDCYAPQRQKLRDPSVSSYEQNRDALLLPAAKCRFFTDLLGIQRPDETDTKLSPGNAGADQVRGLPPTIFGIAGLDPLRDEALLFAKMLTEAG